MAERIQVELVDDIDGSPATHTVTFALDGVTYEIDLNDEHAQELRALLTRYIEAARKPKPEPARTARQQEREEEQTRLANKQLTEQIRGAAQRTREHHKKATEQPEVQAEAVEPEIVEAAPRFDAAAAEKKEPAQASAVSLPLFSSAVD
ncbi:Lsr2 protein [Saccharopolyspora antimicrobica]|uniref:Lsr2 protein n=1 Tax=Saccharopolyspora antimicrobica TaxID=455193 RepID=A0A1I5I6I9_9PSEU|nr:Lsr2 family protein [Saccharopolyspora antimicrobica]RKT83024.1 Lsr2 protein [Saccharopolyspora antimicrobica]SFO55770.1 Lsr2 protein [Saccharopolyspora antimicrobica]